MGWLIAACILVVIGLLPAGIRASYDERGSLVFLYFGPVRVSLYPRKRAQAEKKKASKAANNTNNTQGTSKQSGGKFSDFLPLVKVVTSFLGEFARKHTVRNLELRIILAGSDPCDLSVNYGLACGALENLRPHLDRLFRIKKQHIEIECDYTADESVVIARIDVAMCLAGFLALVVRHGILAGKEYFTIYNKRKGGADL